MSDILQQIVATKKVEVGQRKSQEGLDELIRRAKDMPRPRNFHRAITTRTSKPLNVIAEVKKASPSAGVIRADFDPVAIAQAYEQNWADALSVLTDEKYFQGKLEYIALVKEHVKLPVLRKDFIIDPYQVYEARAAGADAILLIAECLDISQLSDLQILATELNLTTLIEVHDMENLIRVRDHVIGLPMPRYSLIGINNRDLRTFKTDLGTTLRLAELVQDRGVLVSESGIREYADIVRLAKAGVAAVLVGESLMRAPDIGAKLRELVTGK